MEMKINKALDKHRIRIRKYYRYLKQTKNNIRQKFSMYFYYYYDHVIVKLRLLPRFLEYPFIEMKGLDRRSCNHEQREVDPRLFWLL